ncbi:MAG: hypothetical protein AAFP90_21900, partial [Planctomycetota bacterium]
MRKDVDSAFDAARRSAWRRVHAEPSHLYPFAKSSPIPPPSIEGEKQPDIRDAMRAWRAIAAVEQQRRKQAINVARCGIEFRRAQKGVVESAFRLLPVLAITMAIGYPICVLAHGLFDSWLAVLLCAMSTLVGAAAAAWYSAESESRRGSNARDAMEDMLAELDETTARRHHVCVQTLHGAASARKFEHTVMLRSRVKSSARAALRAIDRIEKQIVESALSKSNESERQPNQHSDTDHSHHETSRQPASDTDSDHASRMQYQRESSIPLPLRLAIPDQSDQHWNQFIAHCANGMLTEVWGRITSTQDRYFRGDFVHAQMLPVFIGFADPLPPMIVTHLCRQQLNDRDASVFTDWARSLEAIQSIHTDPQLLSCRVPHAALDFQRMGSIPQIALQSGFEKLGQYGALANAEVSSERAQSVNTDA